MITNNLLWIFVEDMFQLSQVVRVVRQQTMTTNERDVLILFHFSVVCIYDVRLSVRLPVRLYVHLSVYKWM